LSRVAVVVCDHGLGHLRRVVAILDEFLQRTSDNMVRVLADGTQLSRLQGWAAWERVSGSSRVTHEHFRTRTTLSSLLEGDPRATNWADRLPPMDDDLVWCDNLLEILDIRPDAIISGSFFWHEVVAAQDPESAYVVRARRLLQTHQPVVIGDQHFATAEVRSHPRFEPVGLVRFVPALSGVLQDSLYLGAGSGSKTRTELSDVLEQLKESGPPPPFRSVLVEPSLLLGSNPHWLEPATYTSKMFASLAVGCVRPGMGILSDLLTARAFPIAIDCEDHFEMTHNARSLEALGIGARAESFREGLTVAVAHVTSSDRRKSFLSNVSRFSTDGACKAADVIKQRISA
jgi:hypothetical protein